MHNKEEQLIEKRERKQGKLELNDPKDSGTQREYCSKPLKHSIVKRILVF